MPEVIIDPNHRYWVGGNLIPSVSNILDVFFPPSCFYTEEGRTNGHERHEWYSYLAQGIEPDFAPDEKISGAVKGFRKYLAEVKPEYVSGEIPYYHPILRFCGTPDSVSKISGQLAVVDYKPKAKNKRTIAQTAFYYLLLNANAIPVRTRYELRLYDGIYRLENHLDPQDMRRAEILVAAYHASQFYK